MLIRARQAGDTAINVGVDYVGGKGFVGAAGSDAYDDKAHGSHLDFSLSYSQITSVSTTGKWIVLIAGGTQYSVKLSDEAEAADRAAKIRQIMQDKGGT